MAASKKDYVIKFLVEISRILLGITFLFSGFVKVDDPYGTAYKIEDYFTSFHLSSLSFLSLPLSFLQSILELAMGAFMLFGLYRKWNSRLVVLTMLFMTPLALYLAIANPVKDCGCFGDAWVISNWETFFKNIILLACSLFVLKYHERISNFFTGKTYWLAFLYIIAFSCLFVVRNYVYEPLFDFRPYKIGANIPEQMIVEKGKERKEISYMIYSKGGVEQRFTDQDNVWEDDAWEFVRIENEVVSEGEDPKIADLTISQLVFDQAKTEVVGQEDITAQVLSDSNYVFLMISPSLTKMNDSYLSNFEDVENYARDHHYKFYCLTSSGSGDILAWAKENTIDFNFCNTDERTLKTITRSNPGLLLIKGGVVINKWADLEVPAEEDLVAPLDKMAMGRLEDTAGKDTTYWFYVILVFAIPLLILKSLDLFFYPQRAIRNGEETELDNKAK